MYINIYTFVHIYLYVYMYIYIHTYTDIHKHIYIYIHRYICRCVIIQCVVFILHVQVATTATPQSAERGQAVAPVALSPTKAVGHQVLPRMTSTP